MVQVIECRWSSHAPQLRAIRSQVFIQEQAVPESLEWDDLDAEAVHLLALDEQGLAIGCARLLANQHLGRMAVLKPYRGLGVGMVLLQAGIAYAKVQSWTAIHLSAQCQAIAFYRKAGFSVCSSEYLDAGIAHCDMRLDLNPN
jgi:predicted GNAT family N-acyltransferase